ncbi:hypothetical protein FGG08_006053 [Glutinoglossum americanum]|uniref:DUF676 domain-containing protein n=1 Tax=Glutinoglossum americanum TaxID=1670608 RepID=A0A9P8I1Q8_9PEZI|nr:hypothetical protein FGG08_006053 [Glutinoglossum americanum]
MFLWGSRAETQVAATDEYSTRGAYGLKVCHDAEDATVDIIFVHGITGNRETTWTHKASGVFWPRDLLKSDVPKSRILSHGYNADVTHFWAMTSTNRIGNHAMNLANALAQLRDRTETAERPLIFVVHSLGGLVFEDAMISSKNSAEPHIQSILARTIGVCFLATPHCGSQVANWASVLGNLASVVRQTNTDLLAVLKPDSEVLARIQQDFQTMLRIRREGRAGVMDVTCFYEELPVRGVGEIVPKHSAILPSYNSIGIHANHMDMPRFDTPQDAGYQAISAEILRWTRAHARLQSSAPQPAPLQQFGYPAPAPLSSWPSSYGAPQQQQQLPLGWRQDSYPSQSDSVYGGNRVYPPSSRDGQPAPPELYQQQPSSPSSSPYPQQP